MAYKEFCSNLDVPLYKASDDLVPHHDKSNLFY